MKIKPITLGISVGILWGLIMFLSALTTKMFGYGYTMVDLFSFYPGYEATCLGAFFGLVWGFIDGFLGGWIIAKLYNYFADKCKK